MSKKRLIPTIILTVCLLLTSVFVISTAKSSTKKAQAAVSTDYELTTTLSYQGQNNFFYAYGRTSDYLLMEYLAWEGGRVWKNPFENYAMISSNNIHPGYVLDSIIVWVADRSGTININATLSRRVAASNTYGDGNSWGMYHQKATETIHLLTDIEGYNAEDGTVMVLNPEGKSLSNKSVNVTKGDCIIFSCGSGPSNNNVNDNTNFTFKITYTASQNDDIPGEDITRFLKMSTPGAMSGYKHIEGAYQADKLCADETVDSDETTVIIRQPVNTTASEESNCSSSVTAILPIGAVAIVLSGAILLAKKVKRSKD